MKLLLDTQLLLWAAGAARAALRGGAQAPERPAQRAALQRRQPVGDRHQEHPGTGRLPGRAAPAAPRTARQRLRRASGHQPARGEHRRLASPAQGSLRPPAAGPGPQRGHHPPHRRRATGPVPRARAQGVEDSTEVTSPPTDARRKKGGRSAPPGLRYHQGSGAEGSRIQPSRTWGVPSGTPFGSLVRMVCCPADIGSPLPRGGP